MYAELERKTCAVCSKTKPLSDFYRDRRRSFGRARECKICKEVETRKRRAERPELFKLKRKRAFLKEKFDMTIEQWQQMFESQNGRCGICRRAQTEYKRSFAVDHDHASGKIRALLCDKCNTGLGQFRDSIKILEAATEYLKKFKSAG